MTIVSALDTGPIASIFVCVHCKLLPFSHMHGHTVVAVTSETIDRAWFNKFAIDSIQKFADELRPNDGAIGDWEYRFRADIELMVLRIDETEYIWKLTDEFQSGIEGFYSGYQPMRLGVWAD